MSRKPAHQVTAGEGCSKWNDPNPCRGLALFEDKIDVFDFARFTLPESSIVQPSVHGEAQFQYRMLPDHPPYSEMIYRAIHALEEGGGSTTQESMSSYMKSQYNDLPWAHESFLSHHLAKLTEKCMITVTANGCYMFCTSTSNPKKQRKKQKQSVTEKGPPTLQGNTLKRRGRPPKAKKQEKRAKGKSLKRKYAATIEAKVGLEKEQKETKNRKGRPTETKKMGAKETEKDGEEFMEKHDWKLGDDDQEKVVFAKEKMVFYGPKNRGGRPPKAKPFNQTNKR